MRIPKLTLYVTSANLKTFRILTVLLQTEHLMTKEQTASHLNTDLTKGLSTDEAAKRLEQYGPNVLTPPPQQNECLKFIGHLTGFFSILLWVGAILCFISYGLKSENVDNVGIMLYLCDFSY